MPSIKNHVDKFKNKKQKAVMFSKRKIYLVFSIIILASLNLQAQSNNTPDSSSPALRAEQEAKERAATVQSANDAILQGERFLQMGDAAAAEARFQFAVENLPAMGATAPAALRASQGLAQAKLQLAQEAEKARDYEKYYKLIEEASRANPNDSSMPARLAEAKTKLEAYRKKRMDINAVEESAAVTPEFKKRLAEVQKLFFEGDRFFETGQYDEANKRYEKILTLDPYNKAAVEKIRRVERYRMQAAEQARKTQRAKAMLAVTERWTQPIMPNDRDTERVIQREGSQSNIARINDKLQNIIIPSLSFNDMPLENAVRFLAAKSKELDPTGEGVNFVLKAKPTILPKKAADNRDAEPAAPPPTIPRNITLTLSQVPLGDVVRFITNLTNLQFKVDEYAVFILPLTESSDVMQTRTFSVPPGFFNIDFKVDPARPGTNRASTVTIGQTDVKKQLEEMGVDFPADAKAVFLAGSSKLVVKNTPQQLDVIDALIQARQEEEPQVTIEAKFAEFTDDQLRELSFNFYTNFNGVVPSGPISYVDLLNNLFRNRGDVKTASFSNLASAQNSLNGNALEKRIFDNLSDKPGNVLDPFQLETKKSIESASVFIPTAIDSNGNPTRFEPAIVQTEKTEVINTGRPSPLLVGTPNSFRIGGVVGDKGFMLLANLIDQVKNVDLLSVPKVTTKNRTKAVLEVIREMKFPSEYEKPEVPNNPSTYDNRSVVVAIPATPSEFQTQAIGVTLEVTPTIYPDRRIDLDLKPRVTDFEGFIDYGVPINQGDVFDKDIITLVRGKINFPVFNNRHVNTKVQIVDGQTVVMGGLIREDTEKIRDKVPVLGDIPIVGRVFRSEIDKTIKRNLIIFVTANIIRSTGKPYYEKINTTDSINTENLQTSSYLQDELPIR
jgi:general secretion pathway protein D